MPRLDALIQEHVLFAGQHVVQRDVPRLDVLVHRVLVVGAEVLDHLIGDVLIRQGIFTHRLERSPDPVGLRVQPVGRAVRLGGAVVGEYRLQARALEGGQGHVVGIAISTGHADAQALQTLDAAVDERMGEDAALEVLRVVVVRVQAAVVAGAVVDAHLVAEEIRVHVHREIAGHRHVAAGGAEIARVTRPVEFTVQQETHFAVRRQRGRPGALDKAEVGGAFETLQTHRRLHDAGGQAGLAEVAQVDQGVENLGRRGARGSRGEIRHDPVVDVFPHRALDDRTYPAGVEIVGEVRAVGIAGQPAVIVKIETGIRLNQCADVHDEVFVRGHHLQTLAAKFHHLGQLGPFLVGFFLVDLVLALQQFDFLIKRLHLGVPVRRCAALGDGIGGAGRSSVLLAGIDGTDHGLAQLRILGFRLLESALQPLDVLLQFFQSLAVGERQCRAAEANGGASGSRGHEFGPSLFHGGYPDFFVVFFDSASGGPVSQPVVRG